MRFASIALFVACQADRRPTPAPAPPPPIVPHDAAPMVPPAIDAKPSDVGNAEPAVDLLDEGHIIDDAFGGHRPAFPLLSPDGTLAAIDLSQGLGMSSFSTFEVGLKNAQNAVVEHFVGIDHALADRMARGETMPAVAKRHLADVASTITKRVATFTPFAATLDPVETGSIPVGLGALAVATSETKGLDLKWTSDKGVVLHATHVGVRARQYSDRDGGRCGGAPKLESVWWDAARGRVLVAVMFPGHDSCQDEPLLWMLL